MSVALRGNLKDFGIADVFQLIGQQRKTGRLEISRGSRNMWLAFDEGAVVWASPADRDGYSGLGERLVRSGLLTQERLGGLHAEGEASARSLTGLLAAGDVVSAQDLEEITSLLTLDTIFEVLRWSDGSFDFNAQAVPHNRPPEKLLGAEQILMDGLRMVDEWRTFCDRVPNWDRVMERIASFDHYRHSVGEGSRSRIEPAEKLYQLVDGRLTLQRITDLSRLGTFEATRIMAELLDAAVIAPVERRADPRARELESDSASPLHWLRVASVSVLPVALLAGIVYAGFLQRTPPVPSAVFPIIRSPLEGAQLVFEKRRIRHALEAQRYRFGEWPESLSESDRTRLLGRETLAPVGGRPYYYARREGGVLLLAPER